MQKGHKLVSDEDKVWMDIGDGIICTYIAAYPREYKVVWLPTEGQMIGMMPKPWKIEAYNLDPSYQMWAGPKRPGTFGPKQQGNDLKIVILQALAWARWGKEWYEEKQEWLDS